ncbi:MAG: OmpH family outer membrane protein [Saprospiraceae bacterium]|jgi:outer membrane protein|nr:OmpH family outer membrane protein [Saprospiraceae bacterium]MBP9193995.1 OmpH family outer membrane protein [Saprospiraceae bacterium]
MKKLLFSFAFVLTLYVVDAQRIAVADINAILTEMSEYKAAQKELDEIASSWRQEISKEQDKVKSLYNKYQAEQVLLTDDLKKQREEEIVAKEGEVREMNKRRFGPEGDLFKKRQQLVAPIQDKVFAAIENYAAEKGYDLIFDKAGAAGLLFVKPEFDKTEDIKKRVAK